MATIKPSQPPQSTSTAVSPKTSSAKEKIVILDSNQQVTVADPDGKNAQQYTLEPNITAAALSPDGKKLAYVREEQLNHVIFTLDLATRQSTQISKGIIGGDTSTLKWSQKGDRLILSCAVNESLLAQIYSLDPLSGAMTPLTDFTTGYPNTIVSFDSWSMDENTIGFTTIIMPAQGGDSKDIIQILDVKSGQIKTILDRQHSGDIVFIGGSWLTPDGKTIFFDGKHNGQHRIFRIDADGTHLEQVTSDNLAYDVSGPVVFSPDGQSFFAYAADQNINSLNGVPTLFSMDGSIIRQLSNYPGNVVGWIKLGG